MTTQIYEASSLSDYLKNNRFHKNLNFDEVELLNAYESLKNYDRKIIKNKKHKLFPFSTLTRIADKEAYLKSGLLGSITVKV